MVSFTGFDFVACTGESVDLTGVSGDTWLCFLFSPAIWLKWRETLEFQRWNGNTWTQNTKPLNFKGKKGIQYSLVRKTTPNRGGWCHGDIYYSSHWTEKYWSGRRHDLPDCVTHRVYLVVVPLLCDPSVEQPPSLWDCEVCSIHIPLTGDHPFLVTTKAWRSRVVS